MEILRYGQPIAREVVLTKRVIPVGFGELKSGVPVHFVIYSRRAVPTKFSPMKEFVPVNFTTVEVPILVPKIQNSAPKRF